MQWVLLEADTKKYPVWKRYGDAKSTIERGATGLLFSTEQCTYLVYY
jgi:hypothetical protein